MPRAVGGHDGCVDTWGRFGRGGSRGEGEGERATKTGIKTARAPPASAYEHPTSIRERSERSSNIKSQRAGAYTKGSGVKW